MFRFLQYSFFALAGSLQRTAMFSTGISNLIITGRAFQIDRLANFMCTTRKMIRIARIKGFIEDLGYCFGLYSKKKDKS